MPCLEIRQRSLERMHRVVVQNKAYDVALRIFLVNLFQELYKVGALVAVTYQGDCLPGQQVYPGKEGHTVPRRLYSPSLCTKPFPSFGGRSGAAVATACMLGFSSYEIVCVFGPSSSSFAMSFPSSSKLRESCLYTTRTSVLSSSAFSSSILAHYIVRASIVGVHFLKSN